MGLDLPNSVILMGMKDPAPVKDLVAVIREALSKPIHSALLADIVMGANHRKIAVVTERPLEEK